MKIQGRYPRVKFVDQSTRSMDWRGTLAHGDLMIAETAALDDAFIDYTGGVMIEDGVHFGREVMVLTCEHPVEIKDGMRRRMSLSCASIRICKNAYIGSRATILPGVTIGESAYIAAGAVVTKDVPPFELWGGVPAKLIRKIT